MASVVILGMRSMKRRESNLPPERLRAMAEGKTKRTSTRPAEDTFFESFPKGFDAFEEPQRGLSRQRPRPAGTRPGPRVAARGRRGVDEWGDTDDYDDDYWTRVRADEGGFGGSIAAKKGASRPVDPSDPDGAPVERAEQKDKIDPNAATVQASLPNRSKGLADLVETARATPSSAAAEQKTLMFSAPPQERVDERATERPTERTAQPRGAGRSGPRSSDRPTGPRPTGGQAH
ncbi:MAG TPA: hypothetical protein VIR33_13455, partial [Thermopolyspora sp.]